MRSADALLDAACNWLAYHTRITCVLVCMSIYLAFLAEARLP